MVLAGDEVDAGLAELFALEQSFDRRLCFDHLFAEAEVTVAQYFEFGCGSLVKHSSFVETLLSSLHNSCKNK